MMNLSINGREFESKHDPVKYIGIRHLCIVGHAQPGSLYLKFVISSVSKEILLCNIN